MDPLFLLCAVPAYNWSFLDDYNELRILTSVGADMLLCAHFCLAEHPAFYSIGILYNALSR